MRKKGILFFLVLLMVFSYFSVIVSANENQDYTYDIKNKKAIAVPACMMQSYIIDSIDGITLNSPQDIVASGDRLFVLDSLNSRIAVFDSHYQLLASINGVSKSGEKIMFTGAQGIFVSEDQTIYIADTENGRILKTNTDGDFIGEYTDVEDIEKISDGFIFKPQKIVVDQAKRMFIINQGTYEGLVCISDNGEFEGFVGANKVVTTLWQLFWKTFSTEEQQDAMAQFVPVEFSGVAIDSEGFLYSTAKGENENQMIRKFNMNGIDILKYDSANPPQGDLEEIVSAGSDKRESNFIDVALKSGGVYTCLDNTRGRLFTYNANGELLFAMGGLSNQKGSFSNPGAVEWFGDQLVVADRGVNQIIIFSPTEYGKALFEGIDNQFESNFNEATENYQLVKKYNSNSEIAYKGIAKSFYKEGKYSEAMTYAKLGNDTDLYSKAFEMRRREFLTGIIPWLFVAIAIAVVLYIVVLIVKAANSKRNKKKK